MAGSGDHKNLSVEQQAAEVSRVKMFESGMVINPVTIHPDATRGGCLSIDG